MQRLEFLTAASLCLVIQGFPGIVVIPYEPGDTSCMNLVTFDSCPMRCCVIAAFRFGPLTELILSNYCDGPSLWTSLTLGAKVLDVDDDAMFVISTTLPFPLPF